MNLPKVRLFSHIPATAKIFLLQNLAVMVRSGVSLADAISTLQEQTNQKLLKKILLAVSDSIRSGKTFAESLEPYTTEFGNLFINMIRAGEASGRLEEVLNDLYLQTKKEHELLSKIRGALTYPTIIILAMLGIGAFVIVFVLPNITGLFRELDVELPLTTRLLIGLSDFVQAHGLWVALGLVVLIGAIIQSLRTRAGQHTFHLLLLKLPIIGPIVHEINIARIARNLSALIKTDIPIVNTLQITADVLGNTWYRDALLDAAEKIKKGQRLGLILKEYPALFSPLVVQMITIGEETGALDEILSHLATFYEDSVSRTMDTLPTIIEPILMLLIGGAVGVIAVAILMPIYSLTQVI